MDNEGAPEMIQSLKDDEYALTRAELMAARASNPPLAPSKTFVSAQMDERLARKLSAYASAKGITRSEAIRQAVAKLLRAKP